MTTPSKILVHMWWTPLMTFHFGSGEFEIHNGDSKPSIILIDNFKDHIQELKFEIKRENKGFFNNVEIKFITSKTDIVIQFDDDDDPLKACEIFSNVYKIVGPIIDSNKIIIKTET